MEVKISDFVKSSKKLSQCPKPDKPEYAFVGRSNVGKSSLINMITNRNKLARISVRPGKTQEINHFIINDDWYLVDLPGYGFAKVPLKEKEKWKTFIYDYLFNRENLLCVFVLIDSRHAPLKIDLDFINKLGERGVPFVIVFTKTDKLSKIEQERNLEAYQDKLLKSWEELPPIFSTSSFKNTGKEGILDLIEQTNVNFRP